MNMAIAALSLLGFNRYRSNPDSSVAERVS